ncbi:hypothetical protein WICPIJ_000009 [Wickerhamomyces pijperi]|uniref:Uncharacterized protein n=1 Tax=Wickerhamomyces pijperi TaxID=599730 RepID=A0A9P8QHP5_WICPI|nr:hypothetical protein WICPIJ_000009 [Wickerhamomyces pijperi]
MLRLRPTTFLLRPRITFPTLPIKSSRSLFHSYTNIKQSPKPQDRTIKPQALNESQLRSPTDPKPPNPTVLKIIQSLPKPLQKYAQKLSTSPVSHITSFLILHELSAIIPFIALWYVFHEFQFLPTSLEIPLWVVTQGEKFAKAVIGESTLNGFDLVERSKLLVEGASAYGVVKVLLPIRILGSVLCTPWFARVIVEPLFNFMKWITGLSKNP